MLTFLAIALLVNSLPIVFFLALRHQVARWAWPGLWWLGLGTVAIIATLLLANYTL